MEYIRILYQGNALIKGEVGITNMPPGSNQTNQGLDWLAGAELLNPK